MCEHCVALGVPDLICDSTSALKLAQGLKFATITMLDEIQAVEVQSSRLTSSAHIEHTVFITKLITVDFI